MSYLQGASEYSQYTGEGAIDGNVTDTTFKNVLAGCAALHYPSNTWKCELFLNDLSGTKHLVLYEEIIEGHVFTLLKSTVVE